MASEPQQTDPVKLIEDMNRVEIATRSRPSTQETTPHSLYLWTISAAAFACGVVSRPGNVQGPEIVARRAADFADALQRHSQERFRAVEQSLLEGLKTRETERNHD